MKHKKIKTRVADIKTPVVYSENVIIKVSLKVA